MTPELVIFDMDGVLIDSEAISCRVAVESLQALGIAIEEAEVLERFVGISTAAMLRTVERERGVRLPPDLQETMRARVLKVYERELQPVPGVAAMLAELALPRCVASSSHPDRIRRSLEITGLLDALAPHLFSATMVAHGKPAPDLFLLAAARLGTEPGRCVVVEDSVPGVQAGKAAGMTVFGFTGASHIDPLRHPPALRRAGANLVIDDLSTLPQRLRSI